MKRFIKTVVLLVSICFSVWPLTAQRRISETCQNTIDSFLDLRMKLSLCSTDEEAVRQIQDFIDGKYSRISSSLDEEEKMIMENFFITERYNYLKNDPGKGTDTTKKELQEQLRVCVKYLQNGEKHNGWLYVTGGNVIGCYMSFYPVSTALKYGMTQKEFFEKAVEENEGFSFGKAHLAQWLLVAPGIYGGDTKRAERLFLEALETAPTVSEKYFANIYISQFYFEQKQKDKTAFYLGEAEKYFPESNYIRFIKKINLEGYSTFTYKESQKYK